MSGAGADRPILFCAPMVLALLDGRKTQTRRVAKFPAVMGNKAAVTAPEENLIELEDGEFRRGIFHYASTGALSGPYRLSAKASDRLWVREAWRADDYAKDDPERTIYRADIPSDVLDAGKGIIKWKPGIHLPRIRSRLTLVVTDVRVQRLQDISRDDVIAEGITERDGYPITECVAGWHEPFAQLWDSVNGAGAWETNPWICAITFEVIRANIDSLPSPSPEASQ